MDNTYAGLKCRKCGDPVHSVVDEICSYCWAKVALPHTTDYEALRAEVMADPDARRAYERNRAERLVLAAAKAWYAALGMPIALDASTELIRALDALLALESKETT